MDRKITIEIVKIIIIKNKKVYFRPSITIDPVYSGLSLNILRELRIGDFTPEIRYAVENKIDELYIEKAILEMEISYFLMRKKYNNL